MKSEFDPFLRPTFYIDCHAESVQERSRGLVQGITGDREKAVRIFYAVRDGIRYTIYGRRSLPEHFRASYVLSAGQGYCVQKAVLFVTLARAALIPARLRFAAVRNHLMPRDLMEKRGSNFLAYNGYADLAIEGSWIKVAPTFDLGCCRNAGLRPVEFDGEHDALLPPLSLDGRPHIEYVEDRGFFQDVPFDEIMASSLQKKYLSSSMVEL